MDVKNAVAIILIITVLPRSSTTTTTDQCDLNDDACFSHTPKLNWTFNYVKSKQEYIELVSQGKSGLLNPYRKKPGLTRRDGVKVGHVEQVTFEDGRTVDITTRAMRPLLFEVENFLTPEECDHIIKRALDPNELGGGMFESKAKGGLTPLDTYKPTGQRGQSKGLFGMFAKWDNNSDSVITIEEMIAFIHSRKYIILLEKDVHEMFAVLEMDADFLSDGYVDMFEFSQLDTLGMEEYTEILSRENPRFKHRSSNQAWLSMEQWIDQTSYIMRERMVKITGLGREIIYGGERMQVVHYDEYGHYHAHLDTETHRGRHIPCCHQQYADMSSTVGKCKICRLITFLVYLNDVEEGGETAFPIADGRQMTEDEVNNNLRGSSATDIVNLTHGCKLANLVIRPKKGSGVLWYNHYLNETNGWLGEIDVHSLHGGCDVVKGEKWIANLWIPAPYDHNTKDPSTYLNWKDYKLAELQAGR